MIVSLHMVIMSLDLIKKTMDGSLWDKNERNEIVQQQLYICTALLVLEILMMKTIQTQQRRILVQLPKTSGKMTTKTLIKSGTVIFERSGSVKESSDSTSSSPDRPFTLNSKTNSPLKSSMTMVQNSSSVEQEADKKFN